MTPKKLIIVPFKLRVSFAEFTGGECTAKLDVGVFVLEDISGDVIA